MDQFNIILKLISYNTKLVPLSANLLCITFVRQRLDTILMICMTSSQYFKHNKASDTGKV